MKQYYLLKLQETSKNKGIKETIIIGSIIIFIIFGIRIALGLDFTESPFYVVSSGSMIPTLNVNDVLIVQGVDFNDIKVKDIIVFHSPSNYDKIIVHRVKDIKEVNGIRTITTKGDANPIVIPGTDYPITKKEYIGKVIFVIPKLGYVTNIIPPPFNYIIVGIIIALVLFNSINKNKKQQSEQNQDNQTKDSTEH
jgi:signal peptidase